MGCFKLDSVYLLELVSDVDIGYRSLKRLEKTHVSNYFTATGIKLQKTVTSDGNTYTTNYIGDYIYEDNILKQIFHEEGYIEPNEQGGFDYTYQYKDHLDNVRLSYSDLDGDGTIDPSNEIKSEKSYYPLGLRHKGYNNSVVGVENNYKQFQGQEFTEDLGLNG